MTRLLRPFALLLAVAFVFAGCQDNLTAPSPDASSSSSNATARGPGGGPGGPPSSSGPSCDLRVDDDGTADYSAIQAAIDDASAGNVICVDPGTYEEQISVEKSVTLRGRTSTQSSNAATIKGWVSLDADGASLRRVIISRDAPVQSAVDPFGIRITASNTTVANSVVHSISQEVDGGSINGIQAFGNTPISDIKIRGNVVRNFRNANDSGEPVFGVAGIKLQADVSDVMVANNEVSDLHGLFGFGVVLTSSSSADGVPSNVVVENNTLRRINDGSVFDVFGTPNDGRSFPGPYPGSAVAIDGKADANAATVRYNNLLAPNGVESKDGEHTLNAECNWWDDRSGPFDDSNPNGEGTWALERNGATVDYTPWLNAPAPSNACIGGKKPGNGSPGQ
jgi:hypothetical protein